MFDNIPKISVIITAYNYAKYLPKAINSVLMQNFENFELIIVNDGSTDETEKVLRDYSCIDRVKIINIDGVGLAKAANIGIRSSNGEYVIRLDADDYFDENILLVLSKMLDKHPEFGMVYPDYYRINKYGKILDQIRQPKINDEVNLLDRSALAAGAMYRRSCFDEIGGYNEELRYQEDYDFWIKFIDRYQVYNVQLPLMYYRKHSSSMSTNTEAREKSRQYVKRKFVDQYRNRENIKILCVLPVIAENRYKRKLAIEKLCGRHLLSYAIGEVKKVSLFDRIIVDTEDKEIAELAQNLGIEVPFQRPMRLAKLDVWPIDIFNHLINRLGQDSNYMPDVLTVIYYSNPFVSAARIEEAINTFLLFRTDSVMSVSRNTRFHWQPGKNGLKPIVYPRKLLVDEKEMIYEERGGIYVFNVDNLKTDQFLGRSISYVEVNETESIRIDSDFNMWVAERVAESKVIGSI